jgi:hypothetical protein
MTLPFQSGMSNLRCSALASLSPFVAPAWLAPPRMSGPIPKSAAHACSGGPWWSLTAPPAVGPCPWLACVTDDGVSVNPSCCAIGMHDAVDDLLRRARDVAAGLRRVGARGGVRRGSSLGRVGCLSVNVVARSLGCARPRSISQRPGSFFGVAVEPVEAGPKSSSSLSLAGAELQRLAEDDEGRLGGDVPVVPGAIPADDLRVAAADDERRLLLDERHLAVEVGVVAVEEERPLTSLGEAVGGVPEALVRLVGAADLEVELLAVDGPAEASAAVRLEHELGLARSCTCRRTRAASPLPSTVVAIFPGSSRGARWPARSRRRPGSPCRP